MRDWGYVVIHTAPRYAPSQLLCPMIEGDPTGKRLSWRPGETEAGTRCFYDGDKAHAFAADIVGQMTNTAFPDGDPLPVTRAEVYKYGWASGARRVAVYGDQA